MSISLLEMHQKIIYMNQWLDGCVDEYKQTDM